MNQSPQQESLVIGDCAYELTSLDEFGFVVAYQLVRGETRGAGQLVLNEQRIPIEFRLRRSAEGLSYCSFVDLSISHAEKVRWHLRRRKRTVGGLGERSYDELASGKTGDDPKFATAQAKVTRELSEKSYVKSFALMVMLLVMISFAILAAVFLRSQSTLNVANAALVGNTVPVNSVAEGEIAEVFVAAGDKVSKGDLLARLTNPLVLAEGREMEAQRQTANRKVIALEDQRTLLLDKIEVAGRKLRLDRVVALRELGAARNSRDSAKAIFDRLIPYAEAGAVSQLELDEVESLFLGEQANVLAKENLVEQIEFSIDAVQDKVLIIGDRFDDELGKVQMDLKIATAELRELEQRCQMLDERAGDLNVYAPRDGLVYVIYRQAGEVVKVADELIGLSYPGETWAAGHVSSVQASRVMPGQPVTINVPAMGRRMDGVVMAVGYRAMYSKGHYSADFRSGLATDVPVKVYIEDLPENVPSGIRLDMSINTGSGFKWLDERMGYEHELFGSQKQGALPDSETGDAGERVASATMLDAQAD